MKITDFILVEINHDLNYYFKEIAIKINGEWVWRYELNYKEKQWNTVEVFPYRFPNIKKFLDTFRQYNNVKHCYITKEELFVELL
jgi:hypothetical protein